MVSPSIQTPTTPSGSAGTTLAAATPTTAADGGPSTPTAQASPSKISLDKATREELVVFAKKQELFRRKLEGRLQGTSLVRQ